MGSCVDYKFYFSLCQWQKVNFLFLYFVATTNEYSVAVVYGVHKILKFKFNNPLHNLI